jgi:hypothetical protein
VFYTGVGMSPSRGRVLLSRGGALFGRVAAILLVGRLSRDKGVQVFLSRVHLSWGKVQPPEGYTAYWYPYVTIGILDINKNLTIQLYST